MSEATDRTDIDVAALRRTLEARRAEIAAARESSRDARDTVELDQTRTGRLSRMDALQAQAMAQASERRREAESRRMDQALERMETGDYGYCVSCDEPIGAKRLELDPAVPTCIDCARRGG